MTLSYEEVFNNFLGSVSDYQMATLDISEVNELMTEYLHKTLSKSYLNRIFKTCKLDDENQTITYELKTQVDEDMDSEFLINIISKGMTVEWLEPQVKKTSLLHQMITSSKESRFFSQSSHLAELKDLYEKSKIEVRALIRDRGYIYNPYLEDK